MRDIPHSPVALYYDCVTNRTEASRCGDFRQKQPILQSLRSRTIAGFLHFVTQSYYEVAHLFGTLIAEIILASVHVRARKKAGHMGASDLIKALQNLARRGPSTYGECRLIPTALNHD